MIVMEKLSVFMRYAKNERQITYDWHGKFSFPKGVWTDQSVTSP